MPLGRIARAGAVVHDGAKRLLHTILFALPSPDSDAAETHPTPTIRETKPSAAPDISVHDALSEVGPLSFAGSGYALVLLVVVRTSTCFADNSVSSSTASTASSNGPEPHPLSSKAMDGEGQQELGFVELLLLRTRQHLFASRAS